LNLNQHFDLNGQTYKMSFLLLVNGLETNKRKVMNLA
jgi:hypothetical protein